MFGNHLLCKLLVVGPLTDSTPGRTRRPGDDVNKELITYVGRRWTRPSCFVFSPQFPVLVKMVPPWRSLALFPRHSTGCSTRHRPIVQHFGLDHSRARATISSIKDRHTGTIRLQCAKPEGMPIPQAPSLVHSRPQPNLHRIQNTFPTRPTGSQGKIIRTTLAILPAGSSTQTV